MLKAKHARLCIRAHSNTASLSSHMGDPLRSTNNGFKGSGSAGHKSNSNKDALRRKKARWSEPSAAATLDEHRCKNPNTDRKELAAVLHTGVGEEMAIMEHQKETRNLLTIRKMAIPLC